MDMPKAQAHVMEQLKAAGLDPRPCGHGVTAEETFEGARDMIANGILEGVDGTIAYHLGSGRMPVGLFMYNSGGTMMYSVDGFRLTVRGISAIASEDFATVAEKEPSVFMYLSAGYLDERGDAPAHNPKVRFNEEVCPIGSACLAHCAVRWLEGHS